MQLVLKKNRGAAAKIENPLWEQGAWPPGLPRGLPLLFQVKLLWGRKQKRCAAGISRLSRIVGGAIRLR
jgi:hypothetical protein